VGSFHMGVPRDGMRRFADRETGGGGVDATGLPAVLGARCSVLAGSSDIRATEITRASRRTRIAATTTPSSG
jgi:hypothetical protein